MKKLFIIISLCAIYVFATSCERMFGDFLDKAPGVDVTEDTIFSSQTQVETFMSGIYEQAMHTGYPYMSWKVGTTSYVNDDHGNAFSYAASCDEGEYSPNWYRANTTYNVGNITPANIATQDDSRYYVRWSAIRMINTLLERIDKVPDMDPAYVKQLKGEVTFLRALNYFEMFKRWGGVSIITKRFQANDNAKIKRSSVDSTFQFIMKDCDDAIASLPDQYPAFQRGRVTKGAALALKSKALLYAASPLFNTATPYMSFDNPEYNRLLCFGNYKEERWAEAAKAAYEVIKWAPNGGVQLITDEIGGGPDKNYRYAWEKMDNPEIILADKQYNGGNPKTSNGMPWYALLSGSIAGGWGGVCVTQTFVENFYDKRDGTPETWAAAGDDLNQKYAELDYRFHQTVGYNGVYWSPQNPVLETFKPDGRDAADAITGYFIHKWIPENHRSKPPVNFTLFRLAEAYLNYAEAANEVYGPYTPAPTAGTLTAAEAVNIIRRRSGMPDLPTGLSKDDFRARVWKERGIELAWEDQRFWDVNRWMIGEQTKSGPIYGLRITKVAGTNPQQFHYERYKLEDRVWYRKQYLCPFAQSEVNKGFLIQNPGY
ncbi:MAG TPA: RagB/SusD family nutrient uptake outer membrane protein [Bacteroidales bacterium]|nr:RagB/SusD family nutrient uptake outer membrane protein [Bacteroidales bacterium]